MTTREPIRQPRTSSEAVETARRARPGVVAGMVLLLAIAIPANALGQRPAYLAEARADVDGDGRIDVVRIDNPPAVSITLSGAGKLSGWKPFTVGSGRMLASAELTLGAGKPYRGHHVIVAIGHFAATADQPATSEAMVLEWRSRPRAELVELWRGEVGPRGRDGEWSLQVEATSLGLMRYQRRPGVVRCDTTPSYLFPEAYDFSAGRFRPVNPPLLVDPVRELRATRTPPVGASSAPPVVFQATVTSTQAGAANAGELTAPREIDDGDLATAWREDRGGFGKGEFVTIRARLADATVRAVRIVPGDARDRASFAANHRLKRVALLFGDKPAAWIVFPHDPLTDAGNFSDPYWVDLGSPVATHCVSLVVAEVYSGSRGGDTAIAELAMLGDIDLAPAGGYAALTERVMVGAAGARTAAHTLAGGGQPAAEAILTALGSAHLAPRAALRLRRALAAVGQPIGAPALAAGLREALAPADRRLFIAALVRIGEPAVPPVAAILADSKVPSRGRLAAVEVLTEIPGPVATGALLAAAGHGQAALRRQIAIALGDRSVDALPDLLAATAAAGTAGEVEREADLWRAIGKLGRAAPTGPHIAALTERLERATVYRLRYRLFDAAGAIAVPELVTALATRLAATGQSPEEQALRRVAAAALARNPIAEARAALLDLADDPDPGVRRQVAVGLGQRDDGDSAGDQALAARLAGDRWPMVRIAAAGALTPRCQLAPPAQALAEAVERDPEITVRIAALTALVGCRATGVGARLIAVARAARYPLDLRLRAVALLPTLSDRGLTGELVTLLAGFRRDAWSSAEAVQLASSAAAALGALGGRATVAPLLAAAGEDAFPAIQAAALTGLGRMCPASATPLFARLAGSSERSVALAARAARTTCRKHLRHP